MFSLPKANPLYKKISATKVVAPDVLEKLGKGGFTGYLSHTVAGFEACCIFARGKLICAASSENCHGTTGFEAISLMFDKVLETGGEINVYRMTPDIAMCSHALMSGSTLLNGDEVRLIDIKEIMARLKEQGLNGVILFYAPERYGMMFYKDGLPIGFYNDDASSIESSSEEVRKVASLPDARVNVFSTKPIEELVQYDLLQLVNIWKLWEDAHSRHASTRLEDPLETMDATPCLNDNKLAELVEDIIEVASAYLSKEGRGVIENSINEVGGSSFLLDVAMRETFLKRVEADARIIDRDARIEEMIDMMRSEIAGRLAV